MAPLKIRLPALISGLLVLAVGSVSWAAYNEVRQSALGAARERLDRVTSEMASNFTAGGPQRLREARELAARPGLSAYLRQPGPATRAAALDALAQLPSRESANAACELWSLAGERLLTAGRALPQLDSGVAQAIATSAGSVEVIGPLRIVDDSLFFPVVAPVMVRGQSVGYIANWRRVRTSRQSLQQVTTLIGSDAALLLGNAQGDVWTDLVRRVPPPPVDVSHGPVHVEYQRPGRGGLLARAVPLGGTPWILVIEFSRDGGLARASAFLGRIAALAGVVLVAGTVAAWGMSRHITEPLDRQSAEAEARYHRTLDNMMEGCQIIDRDERYVYVNDAAARHGRRTKEELVGRRMSEVYPGIEGTEIFAALRRCMAEQTPINMKNEFAYPDGATAWFELRIQPVPEGVFILSIDITGRWRAEQIQSAVYRIAEAAQGAAGLAELLRAVHDIIGTLMPAKNFYIALYDEATDLISFPYFVDEVDAPPPPRRRGRGITEYVLRSGRPLLVRQDSPVDAEYLSAVESVGAESIDWLGVPLRQGERTIGVLAVQSYAPGVRYDEGHKEMLQYVSTQVAAAIERRRAEDSLQRSEERFRALVEHSGEGIALLERVGRVLYASHSTTQVLGVDPQALIGTNTFDLLHPDDAAAVRTALARLQDAPGRVVAVRTRFRHADGNWRESEGTVANRLEDPVVRAVVFNFRDVTEHHRLEGMLRQAQKMEAVGRLAGGVAHDFNNLLTAIFGYSDLLGEELAADHPGRADLAEIRTAAERASALTRQLLAFSRQQVLAPVVLNLNDVAHNLSKMLDRLLGEDVKLHISPAADLGNVRADPGQLEQVIMNLAVNARDAMPAGGKLTIETANADLTEGYAALHPPAVPGHFVMLAVSDTGTGMDEATKARIFEPFFTTKAAGKGTGLGLATVYGIVKQSGGYIWVYSEAGRGTTFKVYLPRVDAPAERVVAPLQPQSLTGTETVLLAEDDATLRPLAKSVLSRLGYTVLDAENPEEALAAARAHAGPIHLLVADVVMPGASGRDLARRLAESRPDTKVLYVSGYTDDAIVQHGMLEPGLNFLQKPFTPAALARKVRDVLDAS